MAKEWANKDKYQPSSGVLEPHVQMPRAKAIVRTVPAWGERKAAGSAAGGVKPVRQVLKPVRPVWGLQRASLVFVLVKSLGLSQVVVVLVVGLEILQVVSLLGILPLVLNTGIGRVVALIWRGGTIHSSPFVVLVLLQAERVGFLRVVTGVVYVDDIFFCGSSNSLIVRFVEDMSREFEMSMTGELQFFLGLQIKQSMEGTFMHQAK
jgi:hypothetical protein